MTQSRIDRKEIEERIREFILADSDWQGPARKITPELDLIGNGVIDSMGIHQLFSFLQTEFGVSIRDDELLLENFESIRRIGGFVMSKLVA